MKLLIRTLSAAALALAAFHGMPAAEAAEPLSVVAGYGGHFSGFYYDTDGLDRRLPHFALHPPVYYSVPVPRTYGYSPFAYPPTVMTPEVELTGKLEVLNPHVPPKPAAMPAVDQTTAIPQIMINPFVAQTSKAAAQLTSR